MTEAEPEHGHRCKLGVSTADPALRKTGKCHDQHRSACTCMAEHVMDAHPGQDRKEEKAGGENERYTVGDRHRKQIAKGGERQYDRKQRQSDCFNQHGIAGLGSCWLRGGLRRAPYGTSQKEKAPVQDRSPLVAEEERSLLEGGGNAAERRFQVATEALNNGDDRNRDTGGNQTVFDGRGARFVLHETCKNGLHELAPKIHVAV